MTITQETANRDDVLAEFAMEEVIDHRTLRAYLIKHPALTRDLLELFNTLELGQLEDQERQLSTEQEKDECPPTCPWCQPTTPQAEPELMSLEKIDDFAARCSTTWVETPEFYDAALQIAITARAAHSLREERDWNKELLDRAVKEGVKQHDEIERLTKELEQRRTPPTELDLPALKKWALTEAENGGTVLKLIEELEGLRGERDRELDAANRALENAHKVNDLHRAEITRLREALERLLKTAKLLQENAIDCSVNHYGNDHELHGLPGWLEDNQKDIDAASKALQGEGGEA